mmetsp:Transcript_16320/g.23922  ORF Transcript_16320/g.23922 Transcript_16320/m.23922 type:complete len:322 (+) Transcript_16320:32-997(+)
MSKRLVVHTVWHTPKRGVQVNESCLVEGSEFLFQAFNFCFQRFDLGLGGLELLLQISRGFPVSIDDVDGLDRALGASCGRLCRERLRLNISALLGIEAHENGGGVLTGEVISSSLRGDTGVVVGEQIFLEVVTLARDDELKLRHALGRQLEDAHSLTLHDIATGLRQSSETLARLFAGAELRAFVNHVLVFRHLEDAHATVTLSSHEQQLVGAVVEWHHGARSGVQSDPLELLGFRHLADVPHLQLALRLLSCADSHKFVHGGHENTLGGLDGFVGAELGNDLVGARIEESSVLVLACGEHKRTIFIPQHGLNQVLVVLEL